MRYAIRLLSIFFLFIPIASTAGYDFDKLTSTRSSGNKTVEISGETDRSLRSRADSQRQMEEARRPREISQEERNSYEADARAKKQCKAQVNTCLASCEGLSNKCMFCFDDRYKCREQCNKTSC